MKGQKRISFIDRYTLCLLVFTAVFISIPGIPYVSAVDYWCDTNGICNTDWKFRKSITIDKDKVGVDNNAGALTNHPVLISFTGTDFTDVEDETQSAGQDIRFTSKTGTILDYEIERYDETNNVMAIWVEVDSISKSEDTILYMYYGNSGISSAANSANTWNSDYAGVWHMNQTSGGASAIKDSTSNNNHGTDSNTPTFDATGQISKAIDFEASNNEFITTTSTELKTSAALTLEAWIKLESFDDERHIIWQGASGGNGYGQHAEMHLSTGCVSDCPIGADLTSLIFYLGYNGANTATSQTIMLEHSTFSDTSNFHHVVVTVTNLDAGTPLGTLYLDGTSIDTDTARDSGMDRNLWGGTLLIGDAGSDTREFDGIMDEVRISTVAKDADYVKTVYNNENSPSTFYSVGTETPTIFVFDGSAAGSAGTASPPSFTKFTGSDEYPMIIQNSYYSFNDFSAKKTTTVKVGEPVQIKILATDDGGGSDIKRVSLYMNLHGATRELFESNTAISYVNYKDPTSRNSQGIIDKFKVDTNSDGMKQQITVDVTFAKVMPLSDIIIQVVDEVNNSVQMRAVQAIQVVEDDDVKEKFIEEEIDRISQDAIQTSLEITPNWIKQRTKAWSNDSSSNSGFAQGLTGMINENILKVPNSRITAQSNNEISFVIPSYLKNNAEWWTSDMISEKEFVDSLQFLLDNNHIIIKA